VKWLAMGLVLAMAGCVDNADARWQLDHDHVVAVRATPPRAVAGAHITIDALVAHAGGPLGVEAPLGAQASPGTLPALAAAVQPDGSINVPDEATLAAARQALGLAADAPVPLEVGAAFANASDEAKPLLAIKAVWMGVAADNPTMPAIRVAGAEPAESLVIPYDADVPMSVDADPMWSVYWLTSCGTMHDDNEHKAFVHVQPSDPAEGELAVVVRDLTGGVVWRSWPIKSDKPAM
jgi:hypothetical protein